MIIHNLTVFILILLHLSCISTLFDSLRTECVTAKGNLRFVVGRSQRYTESCGMHKCNRFEVFENNKFAVAVPYRCRLDMLKKPGCKLLRKVTKGYFPDCCPIFGCVKGRDFSVIRTSPDGYLEIYKVQSNFGLAPIQRPQSSIKINPFYNESYEKPAKNSSMIPRLNFKKLHKYGILQDVIIDLKEVIVNDSNAINGGPEVNKVNGTADVKIDDPKVIDGDPEVNKVDGSKVINGGPEVVGPKVIVEECISDEANNTSTDLQPCSSPIYCHGRLLHEVQTSEPRIFTDSKTFVDLRMKHSQCKILDNFNKLLNNTNDKPSHDELRKFVNENFEEYMETENATVSDWQENPEFLTNIIDPELKEFASFLNQMWKKLSRKVSQSVLDDPTRYSIEPLNHTFVVPGGRFTESYYWDSYWIISGLLICGMKDTARSIIDNFFWSVEKYGFVPNGSRMYYTKRSQPPLLAKMVGLYMKYTNDTMWLEENIETLEKELNYWLNNNHKIVINDNILLRYNVPIGGPRPESYREDYETAQGRQEFYVELKSGAESGWDYSSRWFTNTDNGSLKNTKVTNIIPVDLNAFYCGAVGHLSEFYNDLGNDEKSKEWKKMHDDLRKSIHEVLWSESEGVWFDVNITTGAQRKHFYPSNMSPLWTNCIGPDQTMTEVGKKVVQYLEKSDMFYHPGGVPTSSIETGQQWDYPNAWPPLQGIIVEGLENSGNRNAKNLAYNLTERWILSNYRSFKEKKQMYEKYDCRKTGLYGGGGEYVVQSGFGWTNGVVLEMLKFHGDTLNLNTVLMKINEVITKPIKFD